MFEVMVVPGPEVSVNLGDEEGWTATEARAKVSVATANATKAVTPAVFARRTQVTFGFPSLSLRLSGVEDLVPARLLHTYRPGLSQLPSPRWMTQNLITEPKNGPLRSVRSGPNFRPVEQGGAASTRSPPHRTRVTS